ncbi:helix-turn-helix transcriptional regulator [Hymenobacter metallicola]|uniref:Response regulator transcription factor n=1 Tax=Hymenobacter metallicola TaxID=2563114 RepID=A0A4Z0Q8N4_9BACT|nr:LuxR C-terminal-related transcriptional regulator [Hymenobacter metallicola]TGE26447.1 response regulator transcription factor [Hymenobacter metallicola]
MSSHHGAILVAAPPTLHRQGLLTMLREACPGLTICLVSDADLLLTFLHQRAYALLILDEAVTSVPLLVLGEQLCAVRRQQPALCFTDAEAPTAPARARLRNWAWLTRQASPTEVSQALVHLLMQAPRSSWTGRSTLSPAQATSPTPFSRRELEVLRLVIDDYCNQEIADQLCLSVRTVESHRRALLQKTGAKTFVGLAVQAVRAGWVAA